MSILLVLLLAALFVALIAYSIERWAQYERHKAVKYARARIAERQLRERRNGQESDISVHGDGI